MQGDTPGESLWEATTPTTDYPRADDGTRTDVAVVGGGITGLTAAYELDRAGYDVAVLEAGRIVERTSGKTTAKVTSQHGLCYAGLVEGHGRVAARQYARANEDAIDAIEQRAGALDLDCDFERRPSYVYASGASKRPGLREEARTASELGLPATFVEETELDHAVGGAVRFDDQAQFHPRSYLLGLAAAIDGDQAGPAASHDSRVFEETRVLDVDPGEPCRVSTTAGTVVADDVVIASHFPVHDRGGYLARLHPRRAYLLAVRIEGEAPRGMYYRTGEHSRTIRQVPAVDGGAGSTAVDGGASSTAGDGGASSTADEDGSGSVDDELLLVGGETHRPGEGAPPSERYERCEAFAREHFDVTAVEHRWSTHDHWSVDDVPYVGRAGPGAEHVYVGTGFGGWGMTGGSAAGEILAALIDEGHHPRAQVFDPLRVTLGASARELVTAGVENAVQLAGKRVEALAASSALPARGEAAVRSVRGRPVAVYRDEGGEVHANSASCPHVGCVVEWNDAERTWDCPCHGSRFTCDGDVVSGPAVEGLEEREL